MSIEVNDESEVAVDLPQVRRLVVYCLDQLHVHPDAELGVMFVDEAAMSELHVKWMNLEGPTDVLSFPMDELRPGTADAITPAGLLGDIVVCPQVAQRQAETAGHPAQTEMLLLVTHGLLHLLGFDHAEPAERAEMFGLQTELLSGFLRTDRTEPA